MVKISTNILVCKALSEYTVRVQILFRVILALSLFSHSAHHHQKEGLLTMKIRGRRGDFLIFVRCVREASTHQKG